MMWLLIQSNKECKEKYIISKSFERILDYIKSFGDLIEVDKYKYIHNEIEFKIVLVEGI